MLMAKSADDLSITLETVDCGICGSKRFIRLFNACDYIYGNQGNWPVAQCADCGVVFMNPRIPPVRIGPFYPTAYYTNRPVEESQSWRKRIRTAVLPRYYGYPPVNSRGVLISLVASVAGVIISRTAGFRRNIHYVPKGRVLDVGCGNGSWLTIYKNLGWETFGTEIGSESASIARASGHDIFLGDLRDAHYPDGSFDAVTLWDALEHIPNPAETMVEVYRVCRPGGRVYVYVPNFASWYARHFQDKWYMFTAPLHYYHYTPQTLTRLLNGVGFCNVHIQYPLGDAGFAATISAATLSFPILHSMVVNFFCAASFRLADRLMPRGHLLAIAPKSTLISNNVFLNSTNS
jgi:SAM-dependent methyltransferase